MAERTIVKPSSEFYWVSMAMKSAMLAAQVRDIKLGFALELAISDLQRHPWLIIADMSFDQISQNIGEKTG